MSLVVLVLPNTSTDGDAIYRTIISETEYLIRLRFNTRFNRYNVELYNAASKIVRGAVRVIPGVPFYDDLNYDNNLPQAAMLMPQTLSPDESPPVFGELGEGLRVQLLSFEDDGTG